MTKNKEVKAGVGYAVGNILIKGIPFVSLPIFSRLLSTQEYGLYNTFGAYEAIVTIFIGMGLHASINNARYDYGNELDKFISSITIITLFLAGIMGLLFVIFYKPIHLITGFSLNIMGLLLLHSFGHSMLNIVNSKLSLDYNYIQYIKYASFNTLVNVVLSLILICSLYSSDRFYGRIIGSAVPLTILGIYLFVKLSGKGGYYFNREMNRYALAYSFPLVWHYLAQQVETQFDRIMITNIKGAEYTGIYSFIYSIAGIFTILFYSTDNVWKVWFYKAMDNKNYCMIRQKANDYISVIAFLSCLLIICSREIIMIMGNQSYWEGIDLFSPIIIGMFFLFLYTIPVGIEYFFKKTTFIALITGIAAGVNVLTNYIFINIYGYKAAAFTTALSYIITFFLHWIIANKILLKKKIEPIFNIYAFAKYIFLVIICAIIVSILNPYPIWKYFISTIVLIIWIICNKKVILYFLKN